MSQLQLFHVTQDQPSTYQFPWYWSMALNWRDGRLMKDKYSPWQRKLWAWLEKRKALEHHPNFNHFHSTGQLYVGGAGMSSCPQTLISAYLHRTFKPTWWNYRHRSRGKIKWKNLDVHLKIYFREHYTFNFGAWKYQPMDTHYLFTCWYAQEK